MIHFFLSLMYAEHQEVGLDPTMMSLDHDRYDITIHRDGQSSTYRTLSLLSDSGAESLLGNGTRVWNAVKIEDGHQCGEPVALKDSWVDPARCAEGATFESIHKTNRSPEAQRLFVSVECHDDVLLYHGDHLILDYTPSCAPDGPFSLYRNRAELIGAASPEPKLQRKVHYRIVFKEVCRPLREETSLVTIFSALAQTALGTRPLFLSQRGLYTDFLEPALKAMHQADWVHRDISPGNILLQADGTSRLADLEYAKQIGAQDEFRIVSQSHYCLLYVH